MRRLIIIHIFIILFLMVNNASAELLNITLDGGSYSPFSKGCIGIDRDNSRSCLLSAINNGEYAIYDFEVRADIEQLGAYASIENPSGREIDVYIYNYGTRGEILLLSKPGLDNRWIRWESVLVDKEWRSSSPEFLTSRSGGRELDWVGPHNIVRLMFYADPGMPPKNEMFVIKSVTLAYETAVNFPNNSASTDKKVWIENGKILAYGIGRPPQNAVNQAQARAMAIRAATVDAQRNLLSYLKGVPIPPAGNGRITVAGSLPGARTENTEYFDDGSVRVTLAISTKRVIARSP